MALNVEKNYANEDQVSKLKRLYKLTPMKAIKGVLAITNPVKVSPPSATSKTYKSQSKLFVRTDTTRFSCEI